jgi:hypothetical protein
LEKLTADPERPWADWRHGRPLTQKQLGGLLKPFCIISVNVRPPGLGQGKGYRRADFEEAWEAYCPGQNTLSEQIATSEASIRPKADEMGTNSDFRSVPESSWDGSKKGKFSYRLAGWDGWTDRRAKNSGQGHSDQKIVPVDDPYAGLEIPPDCRRCFHCNSNGAVNAVALPDRTVWLHRQCEEPWLATHHKQSSR